MARVDNLDHFLTDVADAIRTKTGDSEPIQASSFDTAIENIPSGSGSKDAYKASSTYEMSQIEDMQQDDLCIVYYDEPLVNVEERTLNEGETLTFPTKVVFDTEVDAFHQVTWWDGEDYYLDIMVSSNSVTINDSNAELDITYRSDDGYTYTMLSPSSGTKFRMPLTASPENSPWASADYDICKQFMYTGGKILETYRYDEYDGWILIPPIKTGAYKVASLIDMYEGIKDAEDGELCIIDEGSSVSPFQFGTLESGTVLHFTEEIYFPTQRNYGSICWDAGNDKYYYFNIGDTLAKFFTYDSNWNEILIAKWTASSSDYYLDNGYSTTYTLQDDLTPDRNGEMWATPTYLDAQEFIKVAGHPLSLFKYDETESDWVGGTYIPSTNLDEQNN